MKQPRKRPDSRVAIHMSRRAFILTQIRRTNAFISLVLTMCGSDGERFLSATDSSVYCAGARATYNFGMAERRK